MGDSCKERLETTLEAPEPMATQHGHRH
jgi:hypothetical protein